MSKTRCNDTTAWKLRSFLAWLFSPLSQGKIQKGSDRTFRYRIAPIWSYWPLPHFHEVYSPVLCMDGLHLCREAVVLISITPTGVTHGWYLARSEHAGAREALMSQSPQPVMVIADGQGGFRKAMKQYWPDVRIQRCLFHVFINIRQLTSHNPILAPGKELLHLATALTQVKSLAAADQWVADYLAWERRWKRFLAEKSVYEDRDLHDKHRKLVQARGRIRGLLRDGQLFTFLDPDVIKASGMDALPSMNNMLEGAINSQLRVMLKAHRGMPLLHRIKAIFWWCYQHSPQPLSPARIIKEMPTDTTIADLYQQARTHAEPPIPGGPVKWGTAISWHDLHHQTWKH